MTLPAYDDRLVNDLGCTRQSDDAVDDAALDRMTTAEIAARGERRISALRRGVEIARRDVRAEIDRLYEAERVLTRQRDALATEVRDLNARLAAWGCERIGKGEDRPASRRDANGSLSGSEDAGRVIEKESTP